MANMKIIYGFALIAILIFGLPAIFNAGYTIGYNNAIDEYSEFYEGYFDASMEYINETNNDFVVFSQEYSDDYIRGYNSFLENINGL